VSIGTDYTGRIRLLGWDGLRELWDRSARGPVPGWPPGKAFEYLVLRAFELDGATVRWPFEVSLGDTVVEQIDGAVYASQFSCLVEAKDTTDLVDVAALGKMRTQLARRPAGTLGLIFARTDFTDAAITLSGFFAPQTVLLWPGEEVETCLEEQRVVSALEKKYRECVEQGIPGSIAPIRFRRRSTSLSMRSRTPHSSRG
jgi:hypothetical protein